MFQKEVELSTGEKIIVKPLTWKQIKQHRLLSLLTNIAKEVQNQGENAVIPIDEDLIDKVVRLVIGPKVDELPFEDVLKIFNTVIEITYLPQN